MDQLADHSPAVWLDQMGEATRRRRLDEVQELELLAGWADIHSGDGETDEKYLAHGLMSQPGGEGTPMVMDHCFAEPALIRGVGVMSIINATADVLDLRHRLPKVWAATQQGLVDVWVPRKIAKLSRHLGVEDIGLVDNALAPILGHEGAGRILQITAAKIIEADPIAHQERVEVEKQRRYVGLGRSDEYGLRTLIARIEAGDAAWIDATVTRVAEILAKKQKKEHGEDEGEDQDKSSADELRAIAFGYLARPAELLALLTSNLEPADLDEPEQPEESDYSGQVTHAIALPTDLLAKLNDLNLKALAPKTVLYVHLHQAALEGAASVARVEGLGPVTLTQLKTLLAGCRISVKPVIDLSDRVRATAYEHPEWLKERVLLITGGDYFPYANSTSRNLDYDHVTPYDEDGPPGQTSTDNSGPLGRRNHRIKTHGGYRARQAGPGRYVWITPHRLGYLVDQHGTRRIPYKDAAAIHDAPPGLDLYPGGPAINIPSPRE